jgi:hypothetical protein
MIRLSRYLLSFVLLVPLGHILAQSEDAPTVAPLNIGATITETITENAIFDWWVIELDANQTINITMTAEDGLAPLLGLLNEESALVDRSQDGQPNSTVTLEFTAEESGEYRIVATRAGNQSGTTSGSYTLQAGRPTIQATPTANPYREVTFTCDGADEFVNLLTLEIEEDPEQSEVVDVSVYGLGGADPILRNTLEFDFEPFTDQFCVRGNQAGVGGGMGDRLQLPDEDERSFEDGVPKTNFNPPDAFDIQMNIGAAAPDGGQYVVLISGFTIAPDGDRDLLEVGLGPLARNSALDVYAVSDKSSRLDTFVERIDAGTTVLEDCDDAGQRDCEQVPSIDGLAWYSAEYDRTVRGGRFDGGLRLTPSTPDTQRILFGAFDGRTSGDYTIVIIGEIPER